MTQNSASCLATLDPLYGLFYSTLKVAKKDMEILIMVFLEKKNLIQSNLVNLAQKWYGVLITLDFLWGIFINLTQ